MSEQAGIFLAILNALHDIGIPYMITGSVASVRYGEPRTTLDLDWLPKTASSASSFFNYREGGSEKHLRDIRGIVENMKESLDRQYISLWTDRLGLTELWQTLQSAKE